MTSGLVRGRRGVRGIHRHRGEGPMKVEAKVEVTQPQAKECL